MNNGIWPNLTTRSTDFEYWATNVSRKIVSEIAFHGMVGSPRMQVWASTFGVQIDESETFDSFRTKIMGRLL